MNRNERIEELASRYVLGTLEKPELEELEALLRTDEKARRLFAELCSDEMLLWQHLNLEPAVATHSVTPAPPALPARRTPARRLARVAALIVAFLGGWIFSELASARGGADSDAEARLAVQEPALRILYSPPPARTSAPVVFPLDFDERGRLTLQSTRSQKPLEIANL